MYFVHFIFPIRNPVIYTICFLQNPEDGDVNPDCAGHSGFKNYFTCLPLSGLIKTANQILPQCYVSKKTLQKSIQVQIFCPLQKYFPNIVNFIPIALKDMEPNVLCSLFLRIKEKTDCPSRLSMVYHPIEQNLKVCLKVLTSLQDQ